MKKLLGSSFVLLLLQSIFLLSSCSKEYNDSDLQKKIDELQNQNIETEIIFSTGSLIPSFDKSTKEYSVSSLNSLHPITITVKCNPNYDVFIENNKVTPNKPFEIKIDKLDWAKQLSIKIDNKIYYINTIPDDFPRYKCVSNNPTPGNIYLGYTGTPMMMLSNIGELLYYKANGSYYMDFKKVFNSKGEIRYTAIRTDNTPKVEGVGYELGIVEVMNERFEIIDEVKMLPSINVPGGNYSENHDFCFIDDQHYIVSGYIPMKVNNIPAYISQNPAGTKVVASILQEIKNGSIVWEWNSTKFPHLYESSIESNDYTNALNPWCDYMHFNSMVIDPDDGNLICSFRHQDAIMKINRNDGQIMWYLGGANDNFGLTSNQKLKRQHFAQVFVNSDGSKTITCFDNRTGENAARVVEFTVNESAKTLIDFHELVGPYSSMYMGSAQKRNGTYFIGWGSNGTPKVDATEIATDGTSISFELYLPIGKSSYRAYKIE